MQLDLSKGAIKALTEGDLSTDSGIEACTDAADALQQAMEVQLPLGKMLVCLGIYLHLSFYNFSTA